MTELEYLFEEFKKQLEPTQAQKDRLITSHTYLRDAIQPLDIVEKTILTGSYKRKTLIRPLADVDIFVILNYEDPNDAPTPQSVLNRLKRQLQYTYRDSYIKQDRPCVTAAFNHCSFELTPAIEQTKWNWWTWESYKTYWIPYMGNLQKWIEVEDPSVLGAKLSKKNKDLNGMLIPLIKMMKQWKRYNDVRDLKSYRMEEIAIAKLSNLSDYRSGVEQLLYHYGQISWWDLKRMERMNEYDFADHCRQELFGDLFPTFY